MEPERGFEPPTLALRKPCSATELLRPLGPGGGGEIRTHDTISDIPVFKTGPFNHSGTPPVRLHYRKGQPLCEGGQIS